MIELEGASVVVLRDSVNEYGVGHHYLYSGFIPAIGSHLIELQLYEGGGFALVSRTGRITTLDGKPVLAPGGDRFVTASWDTEAGHDPNRIQIFRYDADSILLEWEMEPELWGPDQPRWENDSTLSIVRRPSLFHPDSASLRAPLILTRAGRRWVADSLRGTP